jgi:hypothetical protein
MPQMGLDNKTDRLTVSRNVTLTLTADIVVTSRYYVYKKTASLRVQRSLNQHELCRPAKISEALHSPLLQR